MKRPAVSILIPTYNYARYLPEAIDSVLAQDFDDFELIIADDASSDNTEQICRVYEANDSRIRFFRHEKNLGMVENWNWCLRQANGMYIKYLLADDKFNRPYALRRLIEAVSRPGVSLAASARALMDESSQSIGIWNPLGRKNRALNGTAVSVRCLERNINLIGEPTAVIFRREEAERGFDPAFRQLVDLEMWLHLLQRGDLAYLHEPLCCFRRHAGQQTEVNRTAGLHLPELIRLGGYMPEGKGRRMKYRWLYHLKKNRSEADAALIESLRKDFSQPGYLYSVLEYKLIRPFENLQHGLIKRIRRER